MILQSFLLVHVHDHVKNGLRSACHGPKGLCPSVWHVMFRLQPQIPRPKEFRSGKKAVTRNPHLQFLSGCYGVALLETALPRLTSLIGKL